MIGRLLAFCMAVVMGASLCRAQPEPAAAESSRGERVFELFREIRFSRHLDSQARRQLAAAAGLHSDFVAAAHARIAAGDEDIDVLAFAIDAVGRYGDAEAQVALRAAARNEALPLRARQYAVGMLEVEGGWYFAQERNPIAGRPPVEVRLAEVEEFFGGRPLAAGGFPPDVAAHLLSRGRKLLHDRLRGNNSHEFIDIFKYLCIAIERFLTVRDTSSAAAILFEHLAELEATKHSVKADRDVLNEGVIAPHMLDVFSAIQWHVGPLSGADKDLKTRKQLEPIAKAALKWWEDNKHHHPDTWRMSNLAAAGYAVTPDEKPHVITDELIRAVQAGTPMEAKAAADVLKSLGFCAGTVPPRRRYGTVLDQGVELVDALIRGEVIEDASEEIIAGKVVSWDAASKRWVQTEEER